MLTFPYRDMIKLSMHIILWHVSKMNPFIQKSIVCVMLALFINFEFINFVIDNYSKTSMRFLNNALHLTHLSSPTHVLFF